MLCSCLCRSYRAPELLFGSHAYDPFALDKWSLGVAIASFFTHIGPTRLPSPESDEEQFTPSFMKYVSRVGSVKREALFEGGFSDFALIGSIFKIMGTPTLDTWPVRQKTSTSASVI
jgi:serine/threonine protein kinase